MTEQHDNLARTLIVSKGIQIPTSNAYDKLGLSFNPFPRAGISDLNSTDYLVGKLGPIDDEIASGIAEYVSDSLFPNSQVSTDKYISAVIRGDYGLGKTQTLLYAKLILESFKELPEYNKRPYIVYIDNPGAKLTELIGSIISQIGEENFKRYLWNVAFDGIAKSKVFKDRLLSFKSQHVSLFELVDDPFDPVNMVSYKSFLDAWFAMAFHSNPSKRKDFQAALKEIIISIFTEEFDNAVIAMYFYELLSENIGLNKTWEILTAGSAKDLDKKEVFIIRAIVKLVESQGYTDFYLFVDEFENVTAGRLSSKDIDRYVSNLRALIDKERNWCALFAMTPPALQRLKNFSPPLAERVSSRVIELPALNDHRASSLIVNYLNLARTESLDLFPFDDSGVTELRKLSQGIPRVFLKSCYAFIQRALEELSPGDTIDERFVIKHFKIEEE